MASLIFNQSVTTGGQTLSDTYTLDDNDQTVITTTTLTSSQADKEVLVTFEFAQLKFIAIKSDKALTIKTNSSSDPDDTITVAAGQALFWNSAMPWDNPFTADVTKFYITNGAASTASVTIWHAQDATP